MTREEGALGRGKREAEGGDEDGSANLWHTLRRAFLCMVSLGSLRNLSADEYNRLTSFFPCRSATILLRRLSLAPTLTISALKASSFSFGPWRTSVAKTVHTLNSTGAGKENKSVNHSH